MCDLKYQNLITATLTVMRKLGDVELIVKIKVLTIKDISRLKESTEVR